MCGCFGRTTTPYFLPNRVHCIMLHILSDAERSNNIYRSWLFWFFFFCSTTLQRMIALWFSLDEAQQKRSLFIYLRWILGGWHSPLHSLLQFQSQFNSHLANLQNIDFSTWEYQKLRLYPVRFLGGKRVGRWHRIWLELVFTINTIQTAIVI